MYGCPLVAKFNTLSINIQEYIQSRFNNFHSSLEIFIQDLIIFIQVWKYSFKFRNIQSRIYNIYSSLEISIQDLIIFIQDFKIFNQEFIILIQVWKYLFKI